MKRATVKIIHSGTNLSYWLENSDWSSGNKLGDFMLQGVRALPFSTHALLKHLFFEPEGLIAVSGESVVVANGAEVDKFMFRYPRGMSTAVFGQYVAYETGSVTRHLAGIALPTEVGIQPARALRHASHLPTVAQTQRRLNLNTHPPLDSAALLEANIADVRMQTTAAQLELLIKGAERMTAEDGYLPDVSGGGGNLRRNVFDGALTLIDVMPVYIGGNRLLGDNPPNLAANAQAALNNFQSFVGRFGA